MLDISILHVWRNNYIVLPIFDYIKLDLFKEISKALTVFVFEGPYGTNKQLILVYPGRWLQSERGLRDIVNFQLVIARIQFCIEQ